MPIPDYQSIMLPLLRYARDEKEHSIGDATVALGDEFMLTQDERREILPSGQQGRFHNRVGWARTDLKEAGLLESPRRGYFRITPQGVGVLQTAPERIDVKFLNGFPSFREFRRLRHEKQGEDAAVPTAGTTPEEALEDAYQNLRESLAADVLKGVRAVSANLFEKIVVELLVSMGYGGSRKEAGRAIGRSGDEGVDGIINEDRLGLDVVYVQAKRWSSTVGRPEIQKFAGALQGQRARKGIFITTSDFSRDAHDYAGRIESKIVLIDGPLLAQLMIDYGIGVNPVRTYELKKVDGDYFSEE